MKYLLIALLLTGIGAQAQKKVPVTDYFTIEGTVLSHSDTFRLSDAAAYKQVALDRLVITNHRLEKKGTIRHIKGILLKDVLRKANIQTETPAKLSECYIACIATDDYKVVFSWNELFNNPLGNQVLIITEKDGKALTAMPDRIAIISASDVSTGRRFVKGIERIVISRLP